MKWKGLDIRVKNDIYSPKPASLVLADVAIKNIKPKEKVLDMCTGSGIVAIAIAKFIHNVKVTASDINPKSISITQKNAKINNVRIKTILADFYAPFKYNQFDIITVHPPAIPYPPKKDWDMPLDMKIATNGGPDGSRLVVRSIVEAKRCLKNDGKLLLLLPHWSNTKKAYVALKKNYKKIKELASKKVEFFPALEYHPDSKVLRHVYKLAKNKIIKIEFKNNKPYSNVSVIQAIKK